MNKITRIYILTCGFLLSTLAFGLAEPALQYRAEASFAFKLSDSDSDDAVEAERFVIANLPAYDSSVSLQRVRNTSLFILAVTAENPKEAASRANKVLDTLEQSLQRVAPAGEFKVWEKAEPPQKPTSKERSNK